MTSEKDPRHADPAGGAQAETRDRPPGPGEQEMQNLIGLCNAGRMAEAEAQAQELLGKYPDAPALHNLLGSALAAQGKLAAAAASYRRALEIEPGYAHAHSNLGNALASQGRFEEALASLRRAAEIDPGNAHVYASLGNTLSSQGKVEEAVLAYRHALKINPNFAQVYNNLGNALMRLGKLDEALGNFHRSIELRPDAETFYNAHSLLIDADDMAPAIRCLQAAINLQPRNTGFKFFMGMLLEYSGKAQDAEPYFDEVRRHGPALERARLDAWNYMKSSGAKIPKIVGSRIEALELGLDAAPPAGLVLEFGVRNGVSIRQIAGLAGQQVHGFDSFEGLPEAWHDEPKGSYTTKGILPQVPDNVTLHDGWFENTLPEFIKTHKEPVRFMNVDCDIYSSTKTILDCLAAQIAPGTVIVFDEYVGNAHWRDDEYKAFQEAVGAYGWRYEYLAFSVFTKQAVVRIR